MWGITSPYTKSTTIPCCGLISSYLPPPPNSPTNSSKSNHFIIFTTTTFPSKTSSLGLTTPLLTSHHICQNSILLKVYIFQHQIHAETVMELVYPIICKLFWHKLCTQVGNVAVILATNQFVAVDGN